MSTAGHVVIITDRAYLPWCATTLISSVLATGQGLLHFDVLHAPDVTTEDRRALADLAERHESCLTFHAVDEQALAVLPAKEPRMSWARLLLPDLLVDVDRVVYLDADTLVLQSLVELLRTEMDDAVLAAVANVTDPGMYGHIDSLGLDPASYFNAGVLIIDLHRWREDDAAGRLVEVANSRAFPWIDQDPLNVVFAGRWKALHPRWNTMNSFWTWPDLAIAQFGETMVRDATSAPAILHFEGPSLSKPWHYLCDHPYRDVYRSMLARTPWAAATLEDRTVTTRLIARLPAHLRLPAYRRLLRARERFG